MTLYHKIVRHSWKESHLHQNFMVTSWDFTYLGNKKKTTNQTASVSIIKQISTFSHKTIAHE